MANDFTGDANCVALWSIDNGAITADSIGGNSLVNTGLVTNDAVDFKEGDASGDFDGVGDFLSIADVNLDAGFPFKAGDAVKKMSICFWVKFDTFPISGSFDYIATKWDAGGDKRVWALPVKNNAGSYEPYMFFGYNGGASSELIEWTQDVVQTGRWYHFGFTMQDSDKSYLLRIWDDTAGALLGTQSGNYTNAINVENAPVYLGSRVDHFYRLDGHLDEVVVFKDILSSAEIDQIRAGTYGASTTTSTTSSTTTTTTSTSSTSTTTTSTASTSSTTSTTSTSSSTSSTASTASTSSTTSSTSSTASTSSSSTTATTASTSSSTTSTATTASTSSTTSSTTTTATTASTSSTTSSSSSTTTSTSTSTTTASTSSSTSSTTSSSSTSSTTSSTASTASTSSSTSSTTTTAMTGSTSTTSSSTSTASTSSTTSSTASTASTSSSTTTTSSSSSTASTSSTSTTTTYGGEGGLLCTAAVRDITSQATAITYHNTGDEILVCQGMIYLGDGADDLDGTGGEFELTMMLGSQTVQPDPQLIWFNTQTRCAVFTEQFPLYVGETVTLKIKSPNGADTSVYVRACIIEVGVESIRDDLARLIALQSTVTNVFDESTAGSGGTGGGVGAPAPSSGGGGGSCCS